jgi:hypothetical protein
MLNRRHITHVVIMTGLPCPFSGPPTINPPDTVAYYLAPDDSVVEVICREYERGKFTTNINQTWEDGGLYHGNYMVRDFADLEKFGKPHSGGVYS